MAKEDELVHYGTKGMRWGVKTNFDVSAGPGVGSAAKPKAPKATVTKAQPKAASAPAAKAKPVAPVAKAAPKASPSAPPSRSFQTVGGKAAPSRSFQTVAGGSAAKPSAMSRTVASKRKSEMTDAERAHRRKMILGGVAIVGVVGVVAVGATAYKGGPKLAAGTRGLAVKGLNKPGVVNLRNAGTKAGKKAQMNVLFKQAEYAQRASTSKAGILASQKAQDFRGNKTVARVGMNQGLSELRRDTAQIKAMNDAEDYVGSLVSKRATKTFANEAAALKSAEAKRVAAKLAGTMTRDQQAQELARVNSVMQRKRQLAPLGQNIGPRFNRFAIPKV